MSSETLDVVVVGGGIIGLATARELLRRHDGLRLVVLEKESGLAFHQTGHSSGVVHSGVYYAPGSLKARLCVSGREAMLDYCASHGIAVTMCGKAVVATSEEQLPALEELRRRAAANGVPGVELLDGPTLREREPGVACVNALWVPGTGVVNFSAVASALADDIRAAGGEIRTGNEVMAITSSPGGVRVDTRSSTLETAHLIGCAGLQSDRLARQSGGAREPRIVPFRGDYYVLRPERRHLINGLVYPVPDPQFPFLGVHSTLRSDGAMWLGPNALLAVGRESYGRWGVDARDLKDALASPGFRNLARRHWRLGAVEAARGYSKHVFVAAARQLFPALRASDVVRGPSGIRAQALAPDGSLVDDFVFEGDERTLHVRNAPSPGATSSLAIAGEIADRAAAVFDLGA
jgi:(S)-2-hydroxyglutarate dehydrogenase